MNNTRTSNLNPRTGCAWMLALLVFGAAQAQTPESAIVIHEDAPQGDNYETVGETPT